MRISLVIVISIFFITTVFFIQDIQKDYHCTKLAVLVGSLQKGLNQRKSVQERQLLMNDAIPILYAEKSAFLSHIGYWPNIFNGFTQAATVENLNLNYPEAAKLLLEAIHFHPFLSNAFMGLAQILSKTGSRQEAQTCQNYAQHVISGTASTHLLQRQECLDAVKKLLDTP